MPVSSLPALREKLRRSTKVEPIEAGQGVRAGHPLVAATVPVLRRSEVIIARAAAYTLLHLGGGPQVNLRQEEVQTE